MPTLTSNGTFPVGDALSAVATTQLLIGAPLGASLGKGRLIHPSLGTLDYEMPPDKWVNMSGDAIIPPIWGSTKTLRGAVNTLFAGDLRDVVCEEHWNQDVAMSTAQLNALLAFWMNPPDPSVAYVHWFPTYANANGYKVVLLSLTVGGQGISHDYLSYQGYVQEEVVLKLRITARV